MIQTRMLIGGSEYIDYRNLNVNRAMSQNINISDFSAEYDSPYGRHANDFQVGKEVQIFAGNGEIYGMNNHYRFNTGSGTVAYDEFATTSGVLFSGAGWSLGLLGSCLDLTGSPEYVNTSLGSNIGSVYSVACWIRPNIIVGSQTITSFTSTTSGNPIAFRLALAGSNVEFHVRSDNGSEATARVYDGVSANNWYHVVGVRNLGSLSLYVNNVLGSQASTSFNTIGVNSHNIGRYNVSGTGSMYFSGLVDDMRLYGVSVANRVSNLYNNGSGTIDYKVFDGILEKVTFDGEENDQRVTLTGRDFGARIVDLTIQPITYTNTEVGSMVRSILSNNIVPDITYNQVQGTSTTIPRIKFNHDSIYDGLIKLGKIVDYIVYVDQHKDLHFEPRLDFSANLNLGSENIKNMRFDTSRQGMFNRFYVYGDRMLNRAPVEILNVGSPNVGGNLGSVFTLVYSPFNTRASILGSVRPAGVFGQTDSTISGVEYLVNFDDRQIIFPSGTTFGYYLPASGGSIVVEYDKQVPIAKYGEEPSSVLLFGPKEKVIKDTSIKDPDTATTLIKQFRLDANPLKKVEAQIRGWTDVEAGASVSMRLDNFGINQSGISIIEASYNFNPDTVNEESPITLKLSRKIDEITDNIKSINSRLTALEAGDLLDTDTLTRIINSDESIQVVGSRWTVSSSTLNWSFQLGRAGPGTNPQNGGRLGSIIASGINFLGKSGTAFAVQFSGGNDYSVTGSYDSGFALNQNFLSAFTLSFQ